METTGALKVVDKVKVSSRGEHEATGKKLKVTKKTRDSPEVGPLPTKHREFPPANQVPSTFCLCKIHYYYNSKTIKEENTGLLFSVENLLPQNSSCAQLCCMADIPSAGRGAC